MMSAEAESPLSETPSANSNEQRNGVKKKTRQKSFERFITVSWSAQREPVDDIVWCEAEQENTWIVVRSVEIIRTRREVLERLVDTDRALVGLDFGFSFPAPFMEFLKERSHIPEWKALVKQVREDLKKNVEDGMRTWIERIGQYREAHLEPNPYPIRTWERQRNGSRIARERMPEPYEQQSLAERFRRSELPLRRAAEGELASTLHIAYNKLTSRYEFGDVHLRGKKAMLGMSMLEQLIEARPDVAIWPFQKQAPLTVAEIFPWIFRREKALTSEQMRSWLATEEDNGTDIPSSVRDLIVRNPEAQRMFFALMGMIRTEARIEKTIRPLRDYPDSFYQDASIQQEGWLYGVGYRSKEQREQADKERDAKKNVKKGERNHKRNTEATEVVESLNMESPKRHSKPSEAPATEEEATESHAPETQATEAPVEGQSHEQASSIDVQPERLSEEPVTEDAAVDSATEADTSVE